MIISIILLPFFGFIFSCLIGKYFNFRISQILTTIFLIISAIFSWIVFFQYIGGREREIYQILNWITSGSFSVDHIALSPQLKKILFQIISTWKQHINSEMQHII